MLTKWQCETILKAAHDPMSPHDTQRLDSAKLSVQAVYKVFEPDGRGLTEVLYRAEPGECRTAWLSGNQLAYVDEGW